MMEQERMIFKSQEQFSQLLQKVKKAAQEGTPIDQIEKELLQGILNLGQFMLQGFVNLQGTGDFGPTMEHEGKTLRRLESTYKKRYVSVFGEIDIVRMV